MRNIKRSEFLVIKVQVLQYLIEETHIWHFLQTEERTKGGRDRKVETVLMFRMEGLMDRDRQTGRIMR